MTTMTFACGAECRLQYQHLTGGDWSGGTVAAQTTYARNGGYAYRFNVGAAGYAYLANALDDTPPATPVFRYYLYFVTLPAADVATMFHLTTATATYNLGFTQSTGKITFGGVASTVSVSAGVWYRLDIRATLNVNPHLIDWKIDGVSQTRIVNAATETNGSEFTLGCKSSSNAFDICFDDLAISSESADYPLAGGSVIGYRVTATSGTHSQTAGDIQNEASTNVTNGDASGGKVNETAPDTTSYVKQVVARSTTYWEGIFDTSAATVQPRGVEQIVATRAASAGANDQKAQLYDGTSAADAYAMTSTPSASLKFQRKHWAAAPSTGAWTLAKFHAVRIRWGFGSVNTATYPPAISWTALEAEFADPVPAWTTPADTEAMTTTPVLKFNSPVSPGAQHFQMQIDTTDAFNSGDLRALDTSTGQTNWTYWDGASWQAFPAEGMPADKSGNEVRYTVTEPLALGTWYRRARAGSVT